MGIRKIRKQFEVTLKSLIREDHEPAPVDGQPRDNFYVPTVMTDIDVIANILDRLTKSGITHSFQGNSLIITASMYSTDLQEKALDDLRMTMVEVVKFLKEQYKGETGKALSIGDKPDYESYDCVANYTSNKMTLCRLTRGFTLPESKAESDTSSKKAEILARGNVPAPARAK